MVRLGARRGDDDLRTVTDKTGRVEGRTVTTSSRGVRGCHSTSDISSTSVPIALGLQLGRQFFEQLAGSVPVDSSYSGAEYGATARGNSSSDVGKKSNNDGWEQTGPADGGPQDPVIVPSYNGHVAGCIWHGQDRGILKSRSRYVSLTGWTPSDPAVTWIYLYFPMFAPPVRAGARLCKPYIQRFAMLGHKTENKLIDLRIRLDTMTVDEVRWTSYRSDEITNI
ncbi:hypothetical protein M9H77_26698 [Catharanthus roseus]|uniref:Uncharacterized protein n=1 Tax=Catharanthus roseus TaxID=4058 RepID=A0ACC0ACA3_CATRO|nr:hypothetical protein M9H77_26698 [Catharanthus roseus]